MEDAESGRQGMGGGDPSRTQSLNPVTGRGPPRRETGGRAEISGRKRSGLDCEDTRRGGGRSQPGTDALTIF